MGRGNRWVSETPCNVNLGKVWSIATLALTDNGCHQLCTGLVIMGAGGGRDGQLLLPILLLLQSTTTISYSTTSATKRGEANSGQGTQEVFCQSEER